MSDSIEWIARTDSGRAPGDIAEIDRGVMSDADVDHLDDAALRVLGETIAEGHSLPVVVEVELSQNGVTSAVRASIDFAS